MRSASKIGLLIEYYKLKPIIMNFFKEKVNEIPQDVKAVRNSLLKFIKEQLSKVEGGEGGHIKGIHVFIFPDAEQLPVYEAAVYMDDAGRFKDEVQRIADDFAIEMPSTWTLEMNLTDDVPPEAVKVPQLEAAIFIRTQNRNIKKNATAFIKVLSGEAEREVYEIRSDDGKITIGREKKAQGADGFFRINTIAFPGESKDPCNKFISRQHAHIAFDNNLGAFILYADEGGIPPRNKIKIRTGADAEPIRLSSTQIGHVLNEGDQVMVGESAILEFSWSK
jgi:hypothetical protein